MPTRPAIAREQAFHDEIYQKNSRSILAGIYRAFSSAKHEFIASIAAHSKDRDLLEIGCGRGNLAVTFAKAGARVTGIDVSEVALEKATELARQSGVEERCKFIAMDGSELNFAPGSIDMVYGSGILHHLDLEQVLTQIGSVLTAGGRGAFLEPLGHNLCLNLFRRATPGLRSVDEHPLVKADLLLIERKFPGVNFSYHHYLTLLLMPIAIVPGLAWLVQLVARLDKVLFRIFPPLQPRAWMVLIEFEKSQGGVPE